MPGLAYTTGMSFFVDSTPAVKPKTENVRTMSVALAAIFMIMAVAQLYSYEDFPATLAAMWLPGGESFAMVLAALLVIYEVFALPFLLGMRLSPAMRVISMVFGWLTVAWWLYITLWQNLSGHIIGNSGLLGATVPLPVGWWGVLFIVALGVLSAWASWGMWPISRTKK
jgi:hypothetical protein